MRLNSLSLIRFASENQRTAFRTISKLKRPFWVTVERGGLTFKPKSGKSRHNPRKRIDEFVVLANRFGAEKTTPFADFRSKSYLVALAQAWKQSENVSANGPQAVAVGEDSFDDLPGLDEHLIGSDGAPRVKRTVSGVRRDPRVRRLVLRRSQGVCESPGCGAVRDYSGFFDVHHILGVEKSDRVWNCVALCPNCHREAHFAPDRERLNQRLLEFAAHFQ